MGGTRDRKKEGRACAWETTTTQGMARPTSPVATDCKGKPCSLGIKLGVAYPYRLSAHQGSDPATAYQEGGTTSSPDSPGCPRPLCPLLGAPFICPGFSGNKLFSNHDAHRPTQGCGHTTHWGTLGLSLVMNMRRRHYTQRATPWALQECRALRLIRGTAAPPTQLLILDSPHR